MASTSLRSSSPRKLVSFDWAIKRLLRSKANFGILEGFLSELLHEDVKIDHLLESESNQEDKDDKQNDSTTNIQDTLSIYPIQQDLGSIQKGIQAPVYKPSFWLLQALAGIITLAVLYAGTQYRKKKHLRGMLKDDRGYLEWILTKDFNEKVKTMIKKALVGELPKPPEL